MACFFFSGCEIHIAQTATEDLIDMGIDSEAFDVAVFGPKSCLREKGITTMKDAMAYAKAMAKSLNK